MFSNECLDLITIDELCEYLVISRNTAYTLLNSGEIKAFKIGWIWKISKEAINEFIKRKSQL